ncbi:calmodulin-binding protein 60 A-like isoform X2 [Oryza brachyantha]|uniref:calmodulin-binding protein 60 A-like isoform X2 n=1 Tax=Oryza brachyantha TaxID=4533 RepID=UPI0007762EF6|nr:calmodulin-binding protein 60 A-like isoform X2 [Oryza brachyantha]
MAPSTRLLSWNDHGGDDHCGGELSRPRRRWRALVLGLGVRRRRSSSMEGVFGFREFMGEEFMGMFLPFFGKMVQKVVSEEVEKAIFRRLSTPAPAPPRLLVGCNQRPRYQLMFLNGLKPVYTLMKLEAKDGSALKVAIVERLENNQMHIVRFGHLSSAKVEVVALHGNFNAKNEEQWTPEDFNKHIVCGREKSAQLLTGNLTLKLNGGEASLENATFTDNSSFTCTKKFRLGLRLVNNSEDRVLEGITEPFRVKERRVEGFEKHYPPMLDDEVWRLEKIGRNGAHHLALSNSGVDTVQKFLQSYVTDEKKLIQTFSKMSQAAWKTIINHAMTCEVGDDICFYEVKDNNMGLFFDAIYQPVGVKFGDSYKPINELNQIEKNAVETMKQVAYENMNGIRYDHKMVNNCPVPLLRFCGGGTSALTNFIPNQQIPTCAQYDSALKEFSSGQTLVSTEDFSSLQGAFNASVDRSRFVQGETSNGQLMGNVTPNNPNQGNILPGPRITPLCIPNNERTYYSSYATASAAHSNIEADQIATQIGQYGHIDRSHLPEESFKRFSPDSFFHTDEVVALMQPHLLPSNSESFSSQLNLVSNDQSSHQFSSNDGVAVPLSPRKWVKIRAALKLASVGRLSRASRKASVHPQARPRLVPTI